MRLLVHRQLALKIIGAPCLSHPLRPSAEKVGEICRLDTIRFASSAATKLFSEKHEWIATKDNQKTGRVGITNHAQEALGDVVYVQVPEVGSKFAQFDEVGAIESVKAASELVTPVSGEIINVNANLEEKPSLVNSDCYGEGWLYDIKLDEPKELDNLMTEEQYHKFLESGEGAQ